MPDVDPFLAEIARPALAAARTYGFALGGGNALVLHGLINRPTEDVDLFTDRDGGIRAAAGLVQAALHQAGLEVKEVKDETDLSGVIYGLDGHFIQLEVIRDDRIARLSLSSLPRRHHPVVMEIGPVMHLDDLVTSKTAAIINRREVRDYIDTAAFLATHTPEDLIAQARRVDPGIQDEDIRMVSQILDRIPDAAFAEYQIAAADVAALRQRFTALPR